MDLRHLELRRQADLAHERVDVLAVVHAVDDGVVHVLNGVPRQRHTCADALAAHDRLEVARDQHLGVELEHPIERLDVGDGEANALATDRHQVRPHGEDVPEEVAGEEDLLVGEPQAQAVGALGSRHGQHLEAHAPHLEVVAVVHEPRGLDGGQQVLERPGRESRNLRNVLGEEDGVARHEQRRQLPQVALIVQELRVDDDLGPVVDEGVRRREVVRVRVAEDQVGDATVVGGAQLLLHPALVGEAGIEHDVAPGRHDHLGVRGTSRLVDGIRDSNRGRQVLAEADEVARVCLTGFAVDAHL